jgi:DNA-binding HxlR family transcriptional regulator
MCYAMGSLHKKTRERREATPVKDSEFCPIHESIQLLQEKWNLHIIRSLLPGPVGFNELGRAIGCNPATLSQRLQRLEDLGVVSRTVHSLMPPRTSYALTPAGAELQDVIDAIATWGQRNLMRGSSGAAAAGISPEGCD